MQTIKLVSYNIHGQELRSGNLFVDVEDETITTESGKKYKVVNDYEFTYKIQKNQIKAVRGLDGFLDFINEINNPDSAFNPSITNLFIQL